AQGEAPAGNAEKCEYDCQKQIRTAAVLGGQLYRAKDRQAQNVALKQLRVLAIDSPYLSVKLEVLKILDEVFTAGDRFGLFNAWNPFAWRLPVQEFLGAIDDIALNARDQRVDAAALRSLREYAVSQYVPDILHALRAIDNIASTTRFAATRRIAKEIFLEF